MTLYIGKERVSPVIVKDSGNNGNSEFCSLVRAYLPAEYSGSTAKGTKLLLNTKDYYIQETAEYTTSVTSLYDTWENSFVGDGCAMYGSIIQDERYVLYKNAESELVTSRTKTRCYIRFLPNTKDVLVNTYQGFKVYSFGAGSLTETTISSVGYFDGYSSRSGSALFYVPFIVKKEEPDLIRTINSTSIGQFEITVNLKDKTGTAVTNKNISSNKVRTVGLWANDPVQRMYVLLFDTASGTLSTHYWDVAEHAGTGKGMTETNQTLPTISAAFKYAVQFPTTLTINGEEVMYSFLNTGGDLYVYSFKESTMMWAEEPEIAQLIKDQLGTFSDNVNIQPQMDGTLYCTNDLIMCAFSFNSDGTITQVAHPCSDYVDKLENLVEFNATVNKYAGTAGLCYRLSTDASQTRGYMFHFVYFKLEPHEDTGELEWVAYDKKRSNYAVESMTGISTGVTGTTEDGRDYVECVIVGDNIDGTISIGNLTTLIDKINGEVI